MAWVRCCGGGGSSTLNTQSKTNAGSITGSGTSPSVSLDVEAGKHYKLFYGITGGSNNNWGSGANWSMGGGANGNGNAVIFGKSMRYFCSSRRK